jgi:hypothetical protein
VEQFEEVDTQAQVKQFLEETRQQLWNLVRIVNILPNRVAELFLISDTSYVWQVMRRLCDGCVVIAIIIPQHALVVVVRAGKVRHIFLQSTTTNFLQIIDQFVPLMQSIIQRNPRRSEFIVFCVLWFPLRGSLALLCCVSDLMR